MKKGISVLICTFNGALRLPKTLEYLSGQTATSKIPWEIILIDNASNDGSADVAEQEWSKYQHELPAFSIIHEEKPGKIYALEQGIHKAQFEYCIICDDDNWLESDYVLRMYNLLEARPDIGAAGGQGIAVSESGYLPDWFESSKDGYAIGKQGSASGDVTSRGYLWGAGMGTRTSLYKKMYANFPSLLTGRLGNQLAAGEDSEYCMRLILKGYKLYYDEELIFKHYLPDNRLTPEYKVRLFNGFDESNQILSKYRLVNEMRLKYKNKRLPKLRLSLTTPLKIIFAKTEAKKQEQRDILTFLSSFDDNRHSLISKITRFCSSDFLI